MPNDTALYDESTRKENARSMAELLTEICAINRRCVQHVFLRHLLQRNCLKSKILKRQEKYVRLVLTATQNNQHTIFCCKHRVCFLLLAGHPVRRCYGGCPCDLRKQRVIRTCPMDPCISSFKSRVASPEIRVEVGKIHKHSNEMRLLRREKMQTAEKLLLLIEETGCKISELNKGRQKISNRLKSAQSFNLQ